MNILRTIFNKTLNSVIFGVGIMVLTGLYIAIGSGMPSVRAAFELSEMQFFQAWPLKVLMAVLVANLTVVTWTRIPLTLPRLGVWMIHGGIVTLILGMAFYYRHKTEGQIYISRGQTVSNFYDQFERSLYVRLINSNGERRPLMANELPGLPRFRTHQAPEGQAIRSDLKALPLTYLLESDSGPPMERNLAQDMALPGDLTVDVIAYYPYADILTDWLPDPASKTVGVQVLISDPHADAGAEPAGTQWLVSSDSQKRRIDFGGISMEHWHSPMISVDELVKSGRQQHRIDVKIGDFTQSLFVQVGQTYELGATGYSFKVDSYMPVWSTFETKERVKAVTLTVKNTNPGGVAEFKRMVLEANAPQPRYETQTDFKLGEPGAGPMGKRQTELLDKTLEVSYAFNDPHHLFRPGISERHIFVTGETGGLTHLVVGEDGVRTMPLGPDGAFTLGGGEASMKFAARRVDGIRRDDRVQEVPPVRRQRAVKESGQMQVMTVRLKHGDWSQIVHLPFVPWAMEPSGPWGEARPVEIPGVASRVQLAFGNTRRGLPATLTLQNFQLVNYPGGTPNDNLFRDFISTLKVVNRATGEQTVGQAKMNQPIYFDHGRWLFFQAAFDKERMATIIGVGNRPAVGVMTAGCVLMTVGLMWAFYLKPVIIRKRKERALREAALKQKNARKQEVPVGA